MQSVLVISRKWVQYKFPEQDKTLTHPDETERRTRDAPTDDGLTHSVGIGPADSAFFALVDNSNEFKSLFRLFRLFRLFVYFS